MATIESSTCTGNDLENNDCIIDESFALLSNHKVGVSSDNELNENEEDFHEFIDDDEEDGGIEVIEGTLKETANNPLEFLPLEKAKSRVWISCAHGQVCGEG